MLFELCPGRARGPRGGLGLSRTFLRAPRYPWRLDDAFDLLSFGLAHPDPSRFSFWLAQRGRAIAPGRDFWLLTVACLQQSVTPNPGILFTDEGIACAWCQAEHLHEEGRFANRAIVRPWIH